jgi:hypothetical protein
MTPLTRRLGHRVARGVVALDPPPACACAWCDDEPADTVLTVDHAADTSVVALGPACVRHLAALRLGIQAAATQTTQARP